MSVSVALRSKDFVRLSLQIRANAQKLFGIDDEASKINGKTVPLTPPRFAVAALRTFSLITRESVRIWLARNDGDVSVSDFAGEPLTDWPHKLLTELAEEADKGLIAETMVIRSQFEKLASYGAQASLQIVKPFVPAFGEDYRTYNGHLYMGPLACASFWQRLNDIAIGLSFLGDVEVNTLSFFEGKGVLDWLDDKLSDVAGFVGETAGKLADTAGNVAGRAAGGFISGLGIGGTVVIGAATYIALKRTGALV